MRMDSNSVRLMHIGLGRILPQSSVEGRLAEIAEQKEHIQILKAHVDLAKTLLIKTNLNMLEVAIRSGFQSAS